jgi:nickel-dependent lactate racemase
VEIQSVKVPQLLWHENSELDLAFPKSWEVILCRMMGHNRPKLTEKEMRLAFSKPIGSGSIREVAKGRHEVAIIFDDLSRPTRAAEILPFVLEELEEAGIGDERIRFIAALGAHGPHTNVDFRKKLGEEIPERFPVYNHNPFGNCTFLGKTRLGTPLAINSEVMACDLRIGIGCICPHGFSGYGGGGKILLPGVASMEAISFNHATLLKAPRDLWGTGKFEGNVFREDIEEATRMAGLDIKVDVVVNGRGETAGLFVGDPILEHIEGVELAKTVYATKAPREADVVVINNHCKANEASIGIEMAARTIKEGGGDLVLIANVPEGQVTHYLFGNFGKIHRGGYLSVQPVLPPKVDRLIIFAPFGDKGSAGYFAPPPSIIWAKKWDDVLGILENRWGNWARVVVYPDATVQYIPDGQRKINTLLR